jgi:hypothetical protein
MHLNSLYGSRFSPETPGQLSILSGPVAYLKEVDTIDGNVRRRRDTQGKGREKKGIERKEIIERIS